MDELDFIGANPINLDTIQVDPKVLGEGSFGCVIKSADGRYAIKVQEETSPQACLYESQVQNKLLSKVRKAAVANVYFNKSDVPSIPYAWRATLQSGCQKAPKWAQQNWAGRFCITVMDFLSGGPPKNVSGANFGLFSFVLLYTVDQGYNKIGFQHLDIKVENLILVPQPNRRESFKVGNTEYVFRGIDAIPRMVDFGLSYTNDAPSSIDVLKYKGSTLMITPFEVVVSRIQPKITQIRNFMYTPDKKHYHWSYDLFSIGMTILNATVVTNPGDYIGFRLITDTTPYVYGLLQRYGLPATGQEAQQPGMVIGFMYNLCIIQYLLGNGMYPDQKDAGFKTFYPFGTVGYDLLFTPESRRIIEWIVAKNVSIYQNDIQRFTQTYGRTATNLVASLLHWNPEKRGGGKGNILKHPYFSRFIKKIK